MTTPPKVRRYHASAGEAVRPVAGDAASDDPPAPAAQVRLSVRKKPEPDDDPRKRLMRTDPPDDGLPDARSSDTPVPPGDPDAQLDAIRRENLSDRQLRIARRIAALHEIEVSSDEEAILRLRQRGIDPAHRAALGKILSSEGHRAQARPAANTPAVMPRKQAPPPAARPGSDPAAPLPRCPRAKP